MRFFSVRSALCLAALLPFSLWTGCEEEPPPFAVTTGAGSSGAGGGGGAAGVASISQSDASDFETDPQVAVLQGQLVGVVWTAGKLDGSASHIGYRFSTDGGSTWGEIGKLESADGDFWLDPDIAIDIQGRIHLVWLAYSRDGTGGQILAAKATESNLNFGTAVAVTDQEMLGFYERPRVAITKTGKVITTYTETVGAISDLAMALSDDGTEWTRASLGTAGAHVLRPFPCAAAQFGVGVGRTWVGFQVDGRIRLAWSDDDGMTWQGGNEVQAPGDEGGVDHPAYCVGDGDQVWVAYGVRATNDLLQRIRIVYSSDGGQTFQSWIDAHDTVSLRFANPSLSMEQGAPRALDLVYYAGAGAGDTVATVRRARTPIADPEADAGLPMLPEDAGPDAGPILPSTVVHQPLKLDVGRNSPGWISEYIGTASSDGKLFIAFIDNTSGEAHVVFERVDSP